MWYSSLSLPVILVSALTWKDDHKQQWSFSLAVCVGSSASNSSQLLQQPQKEFKVRAHSTHFILFHGKHPTKNLVWILPLHFIRTSAAYLWLFSAKRLFLKTTDLKGIPLKGWWLMNNSFLPRISSTLKSVVLDEARFPEKNNTLAISRASGEGRCAALHAT